MPKIAHSDPLLVQAVLDVISSASTGRGTLPAYLLAHQILDLLRPATLRQQVIDDYDVGGKGGGVSYSGASLIADTIENCLSTKVRTAYVATKRLYVTVKRRHVKPGYQVAAIYQLR